MKTRNKHKEDENDGGFDGMTAGVIAVIANKISRQMTRAGMKRVIDHAEIATTLLEGFLNLKPFEVSGYIEMTEEEWGKARTTGKNISGSASEVMANTKTIPPKGRLAIVFTSIGQLGFIELIKPKYFYERAARLGLICCHPMVAFKIQPRVKLQDEEIVYLGMEGVSSESIGERRTLTLTGQKEATVMITSVSATDVHFEPEDIIAMIATRKLLEELEREAKATITEVENQLKCLEHESEAADKTEFTNAEALLAKLRLELEELSGAIATAPIPETATQPS